MFQVKCSAGASQRSSTEPKEGQQGPCLGSLPYSYGNISEFWLD